MTEPSLTIEGFIDRFIALYQQGAYDQALHLIQTSGSRFPEHNAMLLAWQSAMLSRLGRAEEAMQVLATADAQGYWYHERALQNDPDFESLRSNPNFSSLAERMAARRLAATESLRPEVQVTAPAGHDPHPLFLVLHGNSSNNLMTAPLWQPVVEQGWMLAALQSSQPSWTNGLYVWNDVDKALAEVQAQLSDLANQYPIDPQAIVAGGFSMGAHVAVRMALHPAFHLRGVVVMEAWFDEEGMAALEQAVNAAAPSQTRVLLMAGQENTEYATMAQKVHDLLAAKGFTSKVVLSSNAQHTYPTEFAQLLKEGITWVLQG